MQTPEFFYRTSKQTNDPDGVDLNDDLNDVQAKIRIGHKLRRVFQDRFYGDAKRFRAWIRAHLNCSCQSVVRYMELAGHKDLLEQLGPLDLISAYKLIGIDGNLKVDDWTPTVVKEGAAQD